MPIMFPSRLKPGADPGVVTITETTLWTNTSPTSGFSASSIALSQGISNFDYIKLIYCSSANNLNYTFEEIRKVSDFVNEDRSTEKMSPAMFAHASILITRQWNYVSNTVISIDDVKRVQYGQTITNSTSLIPLEIIGMKLSSPFIEEQLWANNNVENAFYAQSVTLSKNIESYRFIRVQYRLWTDKLYIISSEIVPVEYLKLATGAELTISPVLAFSGGAGALTYFLREFYWVSNTSIAFSTGYYGLNTSSNPQACLPDSIYGIV